MVEVVDIITRYFGCYSAYYIVEFSNGKFGSIKEEYITNGKLNKALNGIEMNLSNSVNDVIFSIRYHENVKMLMENGFDIKDALKKTNELLGLDNRK